MKTLLVDPNILIANPWNSNVVSPDSMKKLAASIRELGFVSAVVVRELANGELQILGGQHRVETAVEMGLTEVPVLNVGTIDDTKARMIGLVDNARYGVDDTIGLAKILEDIGMTAGDLASFLPFTEQDFETITRSVAYDLDAIDMLMDEDDPDVDVDAIRSTKPEKTHDILKFRLSLSDAERIRKIIETRIKSESMKEEDELTAWGSALALILLNTTKTVEE